MDTKTFESLVYPCSDVDPTWVHPDLRRQVRDFTRNDVGGSIALLQEEAVKATQEAAAIEAEVDNKKIELEQLLQQVETLKKKCHNLTVTQQQRRELSALFQEQATTQNTLLNSAVRHLHVGASSFGQHRAQQTPSHPKLFPLKVLPHSLPLSYNTRHIHIDDLDEVHLFFEMFLPLFCWDSDKNCVAMRPISAQPCLLAQTRGGTCPLEGCLYSHVEQNDRLKRNALEQVDRLISFTCQTPQLCVVSETLHSFAATLEQCREAVAVEHTIFYFAELIVRARWHRGFVTPGPSPWMVHALRDVPQEVPPTDENLRHPLERQAWANIATYAAKQSLYATRLFQDRPDAVSWRCLLRACATTPAERLWLAKKGITLFPSSPHLQVHYIVALTQSDASPQECCDACLESAQVLANQVAASNYVLEDANYSAVTSRYIAFLFFYVAVFLDRKQAGRVGAMQLLECATGMNGGSFCLLPAAVHNLRMLLIAMNYGKRISHVPIAALSDAPLVLPSFSRNTSLQCAKNILCEQAEFCKACRLDDLLDGVLEDVDAACSLSSVRMAAREGEQFTVDNIDQFVVADIPLSQGAVWLQYVEYLFLLNGRTSFNQFRDAIASTLHSSSTCLTLLLTDYFSFFGADKKDAAQRCCEYFAKSHALGDVPMEALPGHIRSAPAVHPLEWISYFILRTHLVEDDARTAAYLDSVPLELLVQDTNAATLWAFACFKHAAKTDNMQLFRATLERYLNVLRESHLTWWSPLDTWYQEAVGLPHEALLHVYRCVPLLLGTASEQTLLWRATVLEVGSSLGVVHPLFSLNDGCY